MDKNDLYELLDAVSSDIPAEDLMLSGLQGLISAEISVRRHKKGMSQKDFAEYMGVSQGLVSRWEKGDCNYTLETLIKIASKLDIPMQCPFALSKPQFYHTDGNITQFPSQWTSKVYNADSEFELQEM